MKTLELKNTNLIELSFNETIYIEGGIDPYSVGQFIGEGILVVGAIAAIIALL